MVKNYDDMLIRFHTIPACHGQTDRQTDRQTDGRTELLYQYRASAAGCWRAIKMLLFSETRCIAYNTIQYNNSIGLACRPTSGVIDNYDHTDFNWAQKSTSLIDYLKPAKDEKFTLYGARVPNINNPSYKFFSSCIIIYHILMHIILLLTLLHCTRNVSLRVVKK